MINIHHLQDRFSSFFAAQPFNHCVIDNFFPESIANSLSTEFIAYESEKWFYYHNPIEDKKALNDWNVFPSLTYRTFTYLNSSEFVSTISKLVGIQLYPDHGLHGGGWHMHASGGNLNPHLDYSIHPKMGLERKLNLIIYLSKELQPERHGGHLGLWSNNEEKLGPKDLITEIAPYFNRAVLFDTTQNSWHGMSRKLAMPANIFRKSIAVYYLCQPSEHAASRGRALFAPRAEQVGNVQIEEIIKLRSGVSTSQAVYKTE